MDDADMNARTKARRAVRLIAFCIVLYAAPSGRILASPPASPPLKCVVRQTAWCVQDNGEAEITLTQSVGRDEPGNRVWKLLNVHHPEFVLMVISPQGCEKNYADRVEALAFEPNVAWRGSRWDEIRVSLRSDATCTLRLLVTPFNGSDLEWAYSSGIALLGACKDESCTVLTPTIADVTSVYRDEFRRAPHGGK